MRRYGIMTKAKSAQMHTAKAHKRMAGPAPDYPPDIAQGLGTGLFGDR